MDKTRQANKLKRVPLSCDTSAEQRPTSESQIPPSTGKTIITACTRTHPGTRSLAPVCSLGFCGDQMRALEMVICTNALAARTCAQHAKLHCFSLSTLWQQCLDDGKENLLFREKLKKVSLCKKKVSIFFCQ